MYQLNQLRYLMKCFLQFRALQTLSSTALNEDFQNQQQFLSLYKDNWRFNAVH